MWLLVTSLVVAAAVCWLGGVQSGPRPPLPFQITVTRYEDGSGPFTFNRSLTPWKSGTVVADLKLKNTGHDTISVLDCWASQLDGRNVPGGYLSHGAVSPGDSLSPHLLLPRNTSNWMMIAKVSRPLTPGEYAAERVSRIKRFPKFFKTLAWHAFVAFPPAPGPYWLESDPIEIVDGTNGLPRTYQFHAMKVR
jgi:hypothetical protein